MDQTSGTIIFKKHFQNDWCTLAASFEQWACCGRFGMRTMKNQIWELSFHHIWFLWTWLGTCSKESAVPAAKMQECLSGKYLSTSLCQVQVLELQCTWIISNLALRFARKRKFLFQAWLGAASRWCPAKSYGNFFELPFRLFWQGWITYSLCSRDTNKLLFPRNFWAYFWFCTKYCRESYSKMFSLELSFGVPDNILGSKDKQTTHSKQ